MKHLFTLLLAALAVVATLDTADAQNITYRNGNYLGFSAPDQDSLTASQTPLFPTYLSVTIADSSATDTVYVNDYITYITLSDTLSGSYALSLFAAPYMTGGAEVYFSAIADDNDVVITANGDALGTFTTDSVSRQVLHFVYNETNYVLTGSGDTE